MDAKRQEKVSKDYTGRKLSENGQKGEIPIPPQCR